MPRNDKRRNRVIIVLGLMVIGLTVAIAGLLIPVRAGGADCGAWIEASDGPPPTQGCDRARDRRLVPVAAAGAPAAALAALLGTWYASGALGAGYGYAGERMQENAKLEG